MWRLHNVRDSLLHKVLKARYFNHSEAMEAYRGYDPSYSWRSLWGGKALLKDGISWRVGNVMDINVWSDPWLVRDGKTIYPLQVYHVI